MKIKHQVVLVGLVLLVFFSSVGAVDNLNATYSESIEYSPQNPEYSEAPQSNSNLIKSLFNSKINNYYALGYYPNVYETSLQATYYGLYILESVGKLNTVNHSQIIENIMSYYDADSHQFIDLLANRYLDTDFSLGYFYPLSSVLQVTCYAILSLNILGRLDLIDIQETINFIFSCINPGTNLFIGQHYDSGLDINFKISTVDTIYYAVLTLDLLSLDWTGYTNIKDSIIQFINNLQLPGGSSWDSGAFLHDNETSFDSFQPFFEPNLLSAYYCIKTLEIFNMEQVIQVGDFNQFLGYLYDSKNDMFRISELDFGVNYSNIIATAIGLELSEINSFSGIDRPAIISFLINSRNQYGNWYGSSLYSQYELIDTFQIIRSLRNLDEISPLSVTLKEEIGNATHLYYHDKGFSHLSEDYTTMNLLYSTVSAFKIFDRISELDIQALFTKISNSYSGSSGASAGTSFTGYILKNKGFSILRSHPIEFYSSGKKNYIDETGQLNSHKSTYEALEVLSKLYKLNDFGSDFDLTDLLNDIMSTQFLNTSYYDEFGAFHPVMRYKARISEFLSKKIYVEQSYYAIRSMEIISKFLGLAGLNNLTFDSNALYNYIDRNIVETSTQLFLKPYYTTNTENILENTYYMVYILKALGLFAKDTQKIKNYVVAHLNYSNIQNIYYSYKISEILELEINFQENIVYDLIYTIYDEGFQEFYLTPENNEIEHEIFLWICEMARNSKIQINADFKNTVLLGGYNNISVSLYNLVLKEFGSYISFKFESTFGTYSFNQISEKDYNLNIKIPFSSENYPEIKGNLTAYDGTIKTAETEITFQTTYTIGYRLNIQKNTTNVSIEIKGSLVAHENHSFINGNAYIEIFKGGAYETTKSFTHVNYSTYSIFSLQLTVPVDEIYYLEIYLDDELRGIPWFLGNITYQIEPSEEPSPKKTIKIETAYIIPAITLIFAPGTAIIVSSMQLKKLKRVSTRK